VVRGGGRHNGRMPHVRTGVVLVPPVHGTGRCGLLDQVQAHREPRPGGHDRQESCQGDETVGNAWHSRSIPYEECRFQAGTTRSLPFPERSSRALRATMTVDTDINTAPSAGESRMPAPASTPAASGMATVL
jgi:hypothetical protein